MTRGLIDLRRKAEKALEERRARLPSELQEDSKRLVLELEIHQVELEMQNEELRAARLEMEAGLSRYTEIFEFAPVGYVVLSDDGTIREVNFCAARLLGAERKRLVGRRFGSFLDDAHRGTFRGFLSNVVLRGAEDEPIGGVEVAVEPHGIDDRRLVRLTGHVHEGIPVSALVAMEDVTERRRAEAALREQDRLKDDFLAVLSHELRNPLAPIRNSLYVLKHAEPGAEQARKAQSVIDRQVGYLTCIVDDLLDVTRIARGMIELHRQRLELSELVLQTVEDHRRTFEMAGIRLTARSAEPVWVLADPTRVVQALGNLLGNAAKFTNRGGTVEITVRREGEKAVIVVRDDGVGIAPEIHRQLFEPFRQAPQTLARTHGGLGLGLAMVKGLMELHGGKVGGASPGVGCGSIFTIELPLDVSAEQSQPLTASPSPRPRTCRVLIIEDNFDAADSLREALEFGGHDVEVAYDGPSGLAKAGEFAPDIVLCDIGLPGMSGFEIARAIRSDAKLGRVLLIALSGYALPEDVARAKDAGFDRHVAKPPRLEALEAIIAEAPCGREEQPAND